MINNHLNLFKSYAKEDRENQLENDLTRALALSLIECPLLCHEVLQYILAKDTSLDLYNNLFVDFKGKNNLEIGIQGNVQNFEGFDKLFAVSLSGVPMDIEEFYKQNNTKIYEPVTDLYIRVHNVLIIVEVKPDNHNCTSQLYNQAFNALGNIPTKENVVAVDLNWNKLMSLILCTSNFLEALNTPSRFLKDFVTIINKHNPSWLPIYPLASLSIKGGNYKIKERFNTAFNNTKSNTNLLKNRFGFEINTGWANEVLMAVKNNEEKIIFNFFPGNTKGQGYSLFPQSGSPKIKKSITVQNTEYTISKYLHFKFTSFQKYFAAIDLSEDDLKENVMTKEIVMSFSGRKKRGDHNWNDVESFFDANIKPSVEWRKRCNWNKTMLSGKNQFDLSLGYAISFEISFKDLQVIDTDKNNINPLVEFINELVVEIESIMK